MGKSKKLVGILMAAFGAFLFGIGGVVTGDLLGRKIISASSLVSFRLTFGGLILLIIFFIKDRQQLFDVFKNKRNILTLIAFGVFGLLFAQSMYTLSVSLGNPAVATVLQSLSPSVMILMTVMFEKSKPSKYLIGAILLSIFGTFLLVTNGNMNELSVSTMAVVCGLLSAVGVANFTFIPRKLVKENQTIIIVGLGLFIGGVIGNFISPFWQVSSAATAWDWAEIAFIAIFSTAIAYAIYLGSLNYIEPILTSLLDILEPLTASVASVVFLGTTLYSVQLVGIAVVILSVVAINVMDYYKCKAEDKEACKNKLKETFDGEVENARV